MKTLGSVLEFMGASIEELEVWTPHAIRALRLTLTRFLWISIGWFAFSLAASAIPIVGNYIVYFSYFAYGASLLLLIRARATWHAAGLVAGASVVTEAGKNIRDVIGRIEHFAIKDGKPEVKMATVPNPTDEEKKKEWTLLGKTGEWLFTMLACQSVATAFLLIVPAWEYPWFFLTGMFGGLMWIIFAKKFDIDWKDYFGKFGGWYFVGVSVYMVVAKNELHPNAGAVAVMAGILLTLATNQHWYKTRTTRSIVLGGFMLATIIVLLAPYIYPLNWATFSLRSHNRIQSLDIERFKQVQAAAEVDIKKSEDQLAELQVKALQQGGKLNAAEATQEKTLEDKISAQKTYLQEHNPVNGIQSGWDNWFDFSDDRQRYTAGGALLFVAFCALVISRRSK